MKTKSGVMVGFDETKEDIKRLPYEVIKGKNGEADIVLDWKDVARWSRTLGPDVTVLSFPGGLHDLVLSRREIRDEVFRQLIAWAARSAA